MRFDLALLALAAQSVQVFSNPAEAQEESQVETMAESHTLGENHPPCRVVAFAQLVAHDFSFPQSSSRSPRTSLLLPPGGMIVEAAEAVAEAEEVAAEEVVAVEVATTRTRDLIPGGYSCYGSYPVCRWYTYPGYATQCYCSAT
ncbi:hypothetical protein DCS_04005 [Drechmeria coniospora]|uniref:Uncharacterized protein n=1 Tax=Drechmeria coniospora TaxID=98403 RepID=A0A151GIT6_DRECN|nr:hypothetical protein DCS_04005 [Drechmeria coniospora]KYK56998.1 hypothetical protein DCS_04005 [Drechmeria coniospora]